MTPDRATPKRERSSYPVCARNRAKGQTRECPRCSPITREEITHGQAPCTPLCRACAGGKCPRKGQREKKESAQDVPLTHAIQTHLSVGLVRVANVQEKARGRKQESPQDFPLTHATQTYLSVGLVWVANVRHWGAVPAQHRLRVAQPCRVQRVPAYERNDTRAPARDPLLGNGTRKSACTSVCEYRFEAHCLLRGGIHPYCTRKCRLNVPQSTHRRAPLHGHKQATITSRRKRSPPPHLFVRARGNPSLSLRILRVWPAPARCQRALHTKSHKRTSVRNHTDDHSSRRKRSAPPYLSLRVHEEVRVCLCEPFAYGPLQVGAKVLVLDNVDVQVVLGVLRGLDPSVPIVYREERLVREPLCWPTG